MDWSHTWSLLSEKMKIIKWALIGFNIKWRFGLEVVKIARKGFEVLSKGEGQAMARPRNLAKSEEESTCI